MLNLRYFLCWPLAVLTFALSPVLGQSSVELVKDFHRGPGEFQANIDWVMSAGDRVVFSMDSLDSGKELWVSNGKRRGTRLLKDIVPGPGASNPSDPLAFGSMVAFHTRDSAARDAIWVTDGTEDGTTRIFESSASAYYGRLGLKFGISEGFFFEFEDLDLDDSSELYFSDGTAAGTRLVNPVVEGERIGFLQTHLHCQSGRWCYFLAYENEIWRSDGTEAGATRVLTITEGWVNDLIVAGDNLFLAVQDEYGDYDWYTYSLDSGELGRLGPENGETWTWVSDLVVGPGDLVFFSVLFDDYFSQLWVSDGTTEGTHPVEMPAEGARPSLYGVLVTWNGALYFQTQRDDVFKLWRTDGTAGGTRKLAEVSSGTERFDLSNSAPSADVLHFQTSNSDGERKLWRTRGDAASTRQVRRIPVSKSSSYAGPTLAAAGAWIFFSAGEGSPGEALWKTRRRGSGAKRVTRPEKSTGSGFATSFTQSPPYEMLGGKLLTFVSSGRSHELWRMNPDGRRVRAIWKAPVPIDYNGELTFKGTIGSEALFAIHDGDDVREVWITNGTPRGTRLLGEHGKAYDDGYPRDFVTIGGLCFYSVYHGSDPSKESLWVTDGTREGTRKVVAADGSTPCPDAGEAVPYLDELHFLATALDGTSALWRSDGTTAGTVPILSSWNGQSKAIAVSLAVVGDGLTFALRGSTAATLWRSDGTEAGTVEASSVKFRKSSVGPAVDLGGLAVFQAQRESYDFDNQWWGSEGTGVRTVSNGAYYSYSYSRYTATEAVAGPLLFYRGIVDSDTELWVTDGTQEGSRQVRDINSGISESNPHEMLAVGDVVYFAATQEETGTELWRSDGTTEGTVMVADIEPGPASSLPRGLKVMGGRLYFTAERRDIGRELFSVTLPES